MSLLTHILLFTLFVLFSHFFPPTFYNITYFSYLKSFLEQTWQKLKIKFCKLLCHHRQTGISSVRTNQVYEGHKTIYYKKS